MPRCLPFPPPVGPSRPHCQRLAADQGKVATPHTYTHVHFIHAHTHAHIHMHTHSALLRAKVWHPSLEKSPSSMQQIWTIVQHDGPNHPAAGQKARHLSLKKQLRVEAAVVIQTR